MRCISDDLTADSETCVRGNITLQPEMQERERENGKRSGDEMTALLCIEPWMLEKFGSGRSGLVVNFKGLLEEVLGLGTDVRRRIWSSE